MHMSQEGREKDTLSISVPATPVLFALMQTKKLQNVSWSEREREWGKGEG
jgi:hypothetical protein